MTPGTVIAGGDPWEDLLAAGLITPAAEGADLLGVTPAQPARGVVSGSEALAELRAGQR